MLDRIRVDMVDFKNIVENEDGTDEDGKFCDWVYMSNPIEDFYNL